MSVLFDVHVHLNNHFQGRTALCWAVLRADLEMVEAILDRRPSLEGLKTVTSKTTSEVGVKMSSLINVSVVQGLRPLGELQQISAEFAAFGKSCRELQTIHSQPKLRII